MRLLSSLSRDLARSVSFFYLYRRPIQANIALTLNDVGDELTAQCQDMAVLQEQVGSLKPAMAHQDTIIKRLSEDGHVP